MCGGGTGIAFVRRRVLTGARKPRAMFAANARVLKQTHPSCATRLGGKMLTLAFCHQVDASTICEYTVVTEH